MNLDENFDDLFWEEIEPILKKNSIDNFWMLLTKDENEGMAWRPIGKTTPPHLVFAYAMSIRFLLKEKNYSELFELMLNALFIELNEKKHKENIEPSFNAVWERLKDDCESKIIKKAARKFFIIGFSEALRFMGESILKENIKEN